MHPRGHALCSLSAMWVRSGLLALLVWPIDGLAVSHAPYLRTAPIRPRIVTPAMLQGGDAPLADRAAAALVYILPLLDGFPYGSFIYANIPAVGNAAYTLLPLVNGFQSLPFAGLILFIGLSTFTRNTGLSRFVRFNIQQALLLDILLVIPGVLGSATRMFPYDLQVIGTNFWFYLMVLVVGYSWAQVAQGKNPDQVPFISEAANLQIGPF